MRQLTDASGAVTYAQSYDPYGQALDSMTPATSYAFTGEWSDPAGMLYLRARHYSAGVGRFLTRDTWEGDVNRPLSMNRWMYTGGNPVNFLDPDGKAWRKICPTGFDSVAVKRRVEIVEASLGKFVRNGYALQTSTFTYVVAGLAIQCAGTDNFLNPDSGVGLAQVSRRQIETEWGKPIYEVDAYGETVYERGKPKVRAYGLRLPCPDGGLEIIGDPMDPKWAFEYMRRRIKLVTDECKGCNEPEWATDIYIASALSQNGPGFTHVDMRGIRNLPSVDQTQYRIRKDWIGRFEDAAKNRQTINTTTQLTRFDLIVDELKSRGYYVPEIASSTVDYLLTIK